MPRYLDVITDVPSTLGYGLKQKLKEGYAAIAVAPDLDSASSLTLIHTVRT